jgi:hypothetical protein
MSLKKIAGVNRLQGLLKDRLEYSIMKGSPAMV